MLSIQQGDLVLIPVPETFAYQAEMDLDRSGVSDKHILAFEPEAGYIHSVPNDGVEAMTAVNGDRLIKVLKAEGVKLSHEMYIPAKVPKGLFKVVVKS